VRLPERQKPEGYVEPTTTPAHVPDRY